MSPILCSGDVGECLARHLPSRLSMRITRNPVVRGIRVLATKGLKGKSLIRKVYLSFRKTEKGREVRIVLKISSSFGNSFTLTNDHAN